MFAGIAQLVERQPSKLNVAGSNPVSRSKKKRQFSLESCRFFLYCSLLSFCSSLFTKIVVSGEKLKEKR